MKDVLPSENSGFVMAGGNSPFICHRPEEAKRAILLRSHKASSNTEASNVSDRENCLYAGLGIVWPKVGRIFNRRIISAYLPVIQSGRLLSGADDDAANVTSRSTRSGWGCGCWCITCSGGGPVQTARCIEPSVRDRQAVCFRTFPSNKERQNVLKLIKWK